VHWIDPSTLEFLNLLIDQGPTARDTADLQEAQALLEALT
jgi:hypothetical protein